MIEMIKVSKWFASFQALRDVDLAVARGEKVVVCGPSGSGKSTLIRLVNRLEAHQSGRVIVDGVELDDDPKKVDQVRRDSGAEVLTTEGSTYSDELVRTREGWRIASRKLERTWVDGQYLGPDEARAF